jgi:hypothetical protein
MEISADQFVRMVLAVLEKARGKEFDLGDPEVLWALVKEEYPGVDGLATAPSDSSVRRRFAGETGEPYRPVITRGEEYPLATIGPRSVMARQFRRQLERAAFAPGAMGVGTALLEGLERLRGNGIASLAFVNALAAGQNAAEAMRTAGRASELHHYVTKAMRDGTLTQAASSVVKTASAPKPPEPWSDAEIKARLARGYHGGV